MFNVMSGIITLFLVSLNLGRIRAVTQSGYLFSSNIFVVASFFSEVIIFKVVQN